MNGINYQEHWNNVYDSKEVNQLGWYEDEPTASFKLIAKCNLKKDDAIIDIGTGASTLIDKLIDEGYNNIIATDISSSALEKLKARLRKDKSENLTCIVDDLTNPKKIDENFKVDLWHDRTLLHFLVEEGQQKNYLNTLKKVVKNGGYVIIAVFSLDGAKKCSGLNVKNYDQNMIAKFLGNEFELLEWFNHTYIQPSGNERPFVYTLFRRERIEN